MSESTTKQQAAVQTTGHAWDGDLQEFNNPLPRWWLWSFYVTAVIAVIYWFIYPSWPVGRGWLEGFATITYQVDGKAEESRWNTRAKLLHDLTESHAAQRQREFMGKVAEADFSTISNDPDMLAFIRSVGKGLFGDNCAACHGRGGQGVVGLYPNLADDDWLWGGSLENIQNVITNGRQGFMPAFKETFDPQQLDDVAEYVLSLSGEAPDSIAVERGKALFQGFGGGCYYCHGMDGKGLPSQGAANLTDKIWTIADVDGQKTLEEKKAVVKKLIFNGVQNMRKMPTWKGRLSPTEIKVLAVYVHQLGGGQ
ncbi:MAG: cytochrome-c oxidase, cbb3-type subunit III [Gammaproteobacteria bacterium]|nr:cytochrome-c oxidase, cbb3-type subunit III [Gammaproteobacteria bacterium]MCP5459513.1 cytochrome-c oxidase, cbb3-type subunit III [Gammaproteobacteria bacterium]